MNGGIQVEGESASSSELEETIFTHEQRVRGLLLLGAFVVIRAVLARVWDQYFDGAYSTDPAFLVFLGGCLCFSRSDWSISASRNGWALTSGHGGSTDGGSEVTSCGASSVSSPCWWLLSSVYYS
jgi:hypothetical protein